MELSKTEAIRISQLTPAQLDDELQAAGFRAMARPFPEYEAPDVKWDPVVFPEAGSLADSILDEVKSDSRRAFLLYLVEIDRVVSR
ncbi:hypothetical protein [Pararhizobium sp.]|uniref:hypothetical protein n=1 Tax=Pararhizobium sp. TaxID=1977563 RepID=UPI003D13AFE4